LRALAVKVHLEVAAARGDHVPLVKVFALYDPSGQPAGFAWANRVDGALVTRARSMGWSAKVAEPKGTGPITKERVAARLAEFTEKLAEMGLSRRKGKK